MVFLDGWTTQVPSVGRRLRQWRGKCDIFLSCLVFYFYALYFLTFLERPVHAEGHAYRYHCGDEAEEEG